MGKDNTVLVRVNNGEQLDVMPLVGDFNFYGGFIGMCIYLLRKIFVSLLWIMLLREYIFFSAACG